MSVKKTCIMTLQQFEEDPNRKVLKNQEVIFSDINFTIRNQKIESVDSLPISAAISPEIKHQILRSIQDWPKLPQLLIC